MLGTGSLLTIVWFSSEIKYAANYSKPRADIEVFFRRRKIKSPEFV